MWKKAPPTPTPAFKPCHVPTEVIPGLWVCGKYEIEDVAVARKIDLIVPLDSLEGSLWYTGWRGDILYVPIVDMGILPDEVAAQKAKHVLSRVQAGTRTLVACHGGHGRTGYFASIILGLAGVKDPVSYLRERYCQKAVETEEQLGAIRRILHIPPEVAGKWRATKIEWWQPVALSGRLIHADTELPEP